MPGGDGTGPLGLGPGSGWGRGFCARGFSRGLGRRGLYAAAMPHDVEADTLRNRARFLENELKAVKQDLEDLEQKEPKVE